MIEDAPSPRTCHLNLLSIELTPRGPFSDAFSEALSISATEDDTLECLDLLLPLLEAGLERLKPFFFTSAAAACSDRLACATADIQSAVCTRPNSSAVMLSRNWLSRSLICLLRMCAYMPISGSVENAFLSG